MKILLISVISTIALFGLSRLELTPDAAEAMLPNDPEAVAKYQDYLDRFPNDQGALIILENLICTEAGWDLLTRLEADIASQEMFERTISLASPSAKYAISDPDNLDLRPFKDVDFPDAQTRCETAANYRPFSANLLTEDLAATALYAINRREYDATQVNEAISAITNPYKKEAQRLGGRLIVTGEPVMSAELSLTVAKDSQLVALLAVVMVGIQYLLTRSAGVALATLALNGFVLLTAYGSMGLLGIQLTPATSLAIFLTVPLSSAFVVHAFGYAKRNQFEITKDAIPIFAFAGLTTLIGFACTGFTDAQDIQNLAIMGSLGITFATAGVFLVAFPILKKFRNGAFTTRIALPFTVLARPNIVWIALTFLIPMMVYGLTNLRIDYAPSDYLPSTNSARADFDSAGRYFGRMSVPLMVSVEDAEDPKIWHQLKPLVDSLEQTYGVGFETSWLYEHMVEANKAFNGEDSFPQSADALAQLLLWFEQSDLELFMDDTRSRILVVFQIPYLGSADHKQLHQKISHFLEENNIDGALVGRIPSFFETGHKVGIDNLVGLAIGASIVFVVLILYLKSFSLALAGVIVNALPVLFGLSILGMMNIPLDMGSSIVAAIAFGIVLDDTTHLLIRIKRLTQQGYDPATAVTQSLADLIQPIACSTLVITLGFSVLFLAEISLFQDFASLMSGTLLIAFAAEVWLLPMLVRTLMRDDLGLEAARH